MKKKSAMPIAIALVLLLFIGIPLLLLGRNQIASHKTRQYRLLPFNDWGFKKTKSVIMLTVPATVGDFILIRHPRHTMPSEDTDSIILRKTGLARTRFKKWRRVTEQTDINLIYQKSPMEMIYYYPKQLPANVHPIGEIVTMAPIKGVASNGISVEADAVRFGFFEVAEADAYVAYPK